VDSILSRRPLYEWAREHSERHEYRGRGTAYGVPLPDCNLRVVVRRARHGGLFGPLLGEVFVAPTRAARELAMSLFLRHVGVATPPVIGFVTYRVGPLLRRADVFTAEVPNAQDLGEFLASVADRGRRQEAWRAAARLLQTLAQNGVWHPDLNAKNVLIARDPNATEPVAAVAIVLDIDRVRLVVPGDPQLAQANLERLLESLRKRAGDPRNGTPPSETELGEFSALALAPRAVPSPAS
jgi:3-deoxy-D-manno-octulosonic acid kinase